MWFNYKKALGYVTATAGLTAVCVATGTGVVTPAAIIATGVVIAGGLGLAILGHQGGKALFGFGKDIYEDRFDRDYRDNGSEDEYDHEIDHTAPLSQSLLASVPFVGQYFRKADEQLSAEEIERLERPDDKWTKDFVDTDGQYDEFHSYAVPVRNKVLGFIPWGTKEVQGQVVIPEENRWAREEIDAVPHHRTRSGKAFGIHN